MFSTLAGMVMAVKVNCTQMKYNMIKRQDRPTAECIYKNNVDKVEVTEKYEKSKMPESGYMTVAEYEEKSRAKTQKDINDKLLTGGEVPKNSNMVYVPQHNFRLVKYNDPVGSPELTLPRKLNFDRQINAQGIVSSDFKKLVYPAVYYYAQSDCTTCDLFQINLDQSLTDLEKVKKAHIVNREKEPLLSTDKSTDVKFVFRTLTPIDFTTDNNKLVIKEKIGYRHDGIWQTNLWVYDFETKKATKFPQVRDAIVHYWAMTKGIDFDDNRWDIYPMGFDANDENRVVLCAYAYTGDVPKFLGTWSIDLQGQNSRLESLEGTAIPVSIVGFRLEEEAEVIPPSQVEYEARRNKEIEKNRQKAANKEERYEKSMAKVQYKRTIRQMDMETLMKLQERQQQIKDYNKNNKGRNKLESPTGDGIKQWEEAKQAELDKKTKKSEKHLDEASEVIKEEVNSDSNLDNKTNDSLEN